jgi:hypothetical protein
MISPRRVTEIVQRIEWARDDVRTGKHHRQKRIRKGYLDSAHKQLDAALAELRLLAREAWEDE